MTEKFVKSVFLTVVALIAFVATPEVVKAQDSGCRNMVCNNNPTCQRLRNAGNCAGAVKALNDAGSNTRSNPTGGGIGSGNRARY